MDDLEKYKLATQKLLFLIGSGLKKIVVAGVLSVRNFSTKPKNFWGSKSDRPRTPSTR